MNSIEQARILDQDYPLIRGHERLHRLVERVGALRGSLCRQQQGKRECRAANKPC
jgi:hypothetical protein